MQFTASTISRGIFNVQIRIDSKKCRSNNPVIARVIKRNRTKDTLDHCGKVKGSKKYGFTMSIEAKVGDVIAFGFTQSKAKGYAYQRLIVLSNGALLSCDRHYVQFFFENSAAVRDGQIRSDARRIISHRFPLADKTGCAVFGRLDEPGDEKRYVVDGGTVIHDTYAESVLMVKPGDIVVQGRSKDEPSLYIVRYDFALVPIRRADAMLHLSTAA